MAVIGRSGTTMVEIVVALLIMGLVSGIGLTVRTSRATRHAVQSAARDAERAFATARRHAVATGVPTALSINPVAGRIVVHAGNDTIARLTPTVTHGVVISANRDSMAYDQQGLGIGAANLTLVLSRGGMTQSLVVSRLGRVRR